jgi:hypothetical protein
VLARIHATGSSVRVVQRDPSPPLEANPDASLPCWSCSHGADVRDWLRSGQDGYRSPSGLPMNCCRVSAVGAFAGGSAAPRPAARR